MQEKDAPKLFTLSGHSHVLKSISFDASGKILLSTSWDRTARLWNLQQKHPASDSLVLRGHDGPVFGGALTPTGQHAYTASWDGIRAWQMGRFAATSSPSSFQLRQLSALDVSNDNRWLAAADSSGDVCLRRIGDESAFSIPPKVIPLPVDDENDFNPLGCVFSPDGRWLATSTWSTLSLWAVGTSGVMTESALSIEIQSAEFGFRIGPPNNVKFSPNSRWLITHGSDVRFWDVWQEATSKPTFALPIEAGLSAISPRTGKYIVFANGNSMDISIWDWNQTAAPPRPKCSISHQFKYIQSLEISPDDLWLLATGTTDDDEDPMAWVWNLKQIETHAEGKKVTHPDVSSHAFSRDSRWLITGSNHGTAYAWSMSASRPNKTPIVFSGNEQNVLSVAISPDGEWLTTGGYDTTVRIWRFRTPEEPPLVLRGHDSGVFHLRFTSDSRSLITGDGDEVIFWDLDITSLVNRCCKIAGRGLDSEESSLTSPLPASSSTLPPPRESQSCWAEEHETNRATDRTHFQSVVKLAIRPPPWHVQ